MYHASLVPSACPSLGPGPVKSLSIDSGADQWDGQLGVVGKHGASFLWIVCDFILARTCQCRWHTLIRVFSLCIPQVMKSAGWRSWLRLRAHAQGADGDRGELMGLSLAIPLPQGLHEFWLGQNLHLMPLSSLLTCHSGIPWSLLPRERTEQRGKIIWPDEKGSRDVKS